MHDWERPVERDHKKLFPDGDNSDNAWINATFEPCFIADALDEKLVKAAFMERLGKTKTQVEPLMRGLGVVSKTSSGKRYSTFKFASEEAMKPKRVRWVEPELSPLALAAL